MFAVAADVIDLSLFPILNSNHNNLALQMPKHKRKSSPTGSLVQPAPSSNTITHTESLVQPAPSSITATSTKSLIQPAPSSSPATSTESLIQLQPDSLADSPLIIHAFNGKLDADKLVQCSNDALEKMESQPQYKRAFRFELRKTRGNWTFVLRRLYSVWVTECSKSGRLSMASLLLCCLFY